MQIRDLIAAMDRIAPTRFAEPWDNVGLLIGDASAPLSRALLTIDLTPAVLAEAVSLRCEAVVAYHPPIFDGLKRLTAGSMAFEAARRGIAVYSPHTALDAATGGTNDVLANLLGLTNIAPLRPTAGKATTCKLITFAPEEVADRVADALFAAGAGEIGEYRKCSFRSAGQGTFQGSETSNPAVGQAGKFERAREIKIETIVPLAKVAAVVDALRKHHPYEEPAFDLTALVAAPEAGGVGVGRVGDLKAHLPLGDFISQVKRALNLTYLQVSTPTPLDTVISRVAVCAGAGRSLIGDVAAAGAQVYLTGELPHHDAVSLQRSGIVALTTLHSNTERPALPALAQSLCRELPEITPLLSERDADPFTIM